MGSEFSPLGRIRIGGQSMVLNDSDSRVSESAVDMMVLGVASTPPGEMDLDLYSATVAELGFTEHVTWQQVRDRVIELGYRHCPPDAGIQLYRLLRAGRWLPGCDYHLWLVMEPISRSRGGLGVFVVGCSGRFWVLDSGNGRPDNVLYPSFRVVFAVFPR